MVATPVTLTFDDILLAPGGEARIADGYGSFRWSQAGVYSPDGALGGYTPTSGANLAFISEAGGAEVAGYEDAASGAPLVITRDTPFDLLAADFSAASRDGTAITVRVFADVAGTTLLGEVTLTANRNVAQSFAFDPALFSGALRVEFSANDGNSATNDYFGIDNLTFRDSVAPPPPPPPADGRITLTFDDIALAEGAEARIADGYAGFSWTQAGVYNPDGAIGGYTTSTGQNLAFISEAGGVEIAGYEDAASGTPFVITRETAFDLISADFSAASRDGTVITVSAYADSEGTTLLGTVTLTANRGTAQTVNFDAALFSNAERIEFSANDGNAATADYFGIDTLVLREAVPVTLSFDDIALSEGGEAPLADGYGGFDWAGVGVYNPDGAIAGYQATSGSNLAFLAEANGGDIAGYEDHAGGTAAVLTNADGFTFLGGSFSAAGRNDVDIVITAYADVAGTQQIGQATIQIDQGAQGFSFDATNVTGTFANATRLEFASNDGNAATNDYFGFDDLLLLV